MKEFIEKIIQNLNSNGFPAKRVSLPMEKMFEAADNKGFSFNKVMEVMKADYNIDSQISGEKIIFSQAQVEAKAESKEDMIRQAQEMMAKMDPEELRKIQEMFNNMTPEQKEEIMKKGRDMGLL